MFFHGISYKPHIHIEKHMMAALIQRENEEFTFQVTVRIEGTMLEMEAAIQDAVNDLGRSATGEALQHFDTDGSPIHAGVDQVDGTFARRQHLPDALWAGAHRTSRLFQRGLNDLPHRPNPQKISRKLESRCELSRSLRITVIQAAWARCVAQGSVARVD